MRLRAILSFVSLFILRSLASTGPAAAALAGAGSPELPFAFVQNTGQYEPAVRYIGNGPEFKAWFRDGEVTFQQGAAVTTAGFVNGRPHPRIEALDPIGASANYLRGANPQGWQTDLPLFGSLRYSGVWEGIEIRFRADNSRTKAEYAVAPGASVDRIRLRFEGRTRIQSDGSLVVSGASGEFRENEPFLFQGEGKDKTAVEGAFHRFDDGTIGFTVPAYDHRKPLIIDPS